MPYTWDIRRHVHLNVENRNVENSKCGTYLVITAYVYVVAFKGDRLSTIP